MNLPWTKKKKPTPEMVETKLGNMDSRLHRREEAVRMRKERARLKAKEALASGDERGFRQSSQECTGLSKQEKMIGGMIDAASLMLSTLRMQREMGDLFAAGKDLSEIQEMLGFDTEDIEKATTGIRVAVERVSDASESLMTQVESLANVTPEATTEQEALRAELMSELAVDGQTSSPLEKKIKQAQSQ
jgi:hypothetical protein